MAEIKYRFFLKFGEREHIVALQKKGQVYMNTLDYFRKLPSENFFRDKYEGITLLRHFKDLVFKGEHNGRKFSVASRGIVYSYPSKKIEGNIYCLYGGDEHTLEKFYNGDHGILSLGETFGTTEYMAIINNPREFMRRLTLHLEMAGHKPKYAGVTYLDFKKYQGKLNQFCKRTEYQGQNEFRIFVENDIDSPLCFEIGDLSDICTVALTSRNINIKYKAFESETDVEKEKIRLKREGLSD